MHQVQGWLIKLSVYLYFVLVKFHFILGEYLIINYLFTEMSTDLPKNQNSSGETDSNSDSEVSIVYKNFVDS